MEQATKITCDRCGDECADNFTERHFGMDSETGYRDVEVVCGACTEEETHAH